MENFVDCSVGDLKVGDVFKQDGPLRGRNLLLEVVEKPHLDDRYGLPHYLLQVVVENPIGREFKGKQWRQIPDGAVVQKRVSLPSGAVWTRAEDLRLGDKMALPKGIFTVKLLEDATEHGMLIVQESEEHGMSGITHKDTLFAVYPRGTAAPTKREPELVSTTCKAGHVKLGDRLLLDTKYPVEVVKHAWSGMWPFDSTHVTLTMQDKQGEQFTKEYRSNATLIKLVERPPVKP